MKHYLISSLILMGTCTSFPAKSPLKFINTHDTIERLDRILGTDGWTVRQIMQFRKMMAEILYGKPVRSLEAIKGSFEINGSWYTLKSLASIETDREKSPELSNADLRTSLPRIKNLIESELRSFVMRDENFNAFLRSLHKEWIANNENSSLTRLKFDEGYLLSEISSYQQLQNFCQEFDSLLAATISEEEN